MSCRKMTVRNNGFGWMYNNLITPPRKIDPFRNGRKSGVVYSSPYKFNFTFLKIMFGISVHGSCPSEKNISLKSYAAIPNTVNRRKSWVWKMNSFNILNWWRTKYNTRCNLFFEYCFQSIRVTETNRSL